MVVSFAHHSCLASCMYMNIALIPTNVTLLICMYVHMPIHQDRYVNMPYLSWEMLPLGTNHTKLTIAGGKVEISIDIKVQFLHSITVIFSISAFCSANKLCDTYVAFASKLTVPLQNTVCAWHHFHNYTHWQDLATKKLRHNYRVYLACSNVVSHASPHPPTQKPGRVWGTVQIYQVSVQKFQDINQIAELWALHRKSMKYAEHGLVTYVSLFAHVYCTSGIFNFC